MCVRARVCVFARVRVYLRVCHQMQVWSGLALSASSDRSIKCCAVGGMSRADVRSEFVGHSDAVFCVDCTSEGVIFSGSADRSVRAWDATSGSSLYVLEGHTDWVSCVK